MWRLLEAEAVLNFLLASRKLPSHAETLIKAAAAAAAAQMAEFLNKLSSTPPVGQCSMDSAQLQNFKAFFEGFWNVLGALRALWSTLKHFKAFKNVLGALWTLLSILKHY